MCGTTEIFIRERMHALSGKRQAVTAEDASLFLARFANGSLATFEATRFARGHKALFTLEVNGEHGSIAWDLHDLHRLQFFSHHDEGVVRGWRTIHVSDGDHPYMKAWWVPGLQIGYEHTFVHQVADFLSGLRTGEKRRAGLSRRPCSRRRGGRGAAVGDVAAAGSQSRRFPRRPVWRVSVRALRVTRLRCQSAS